MTKNDNQLLYLYSENCRMRLVKIAKLLKRSSQRLKYQLKTLLREGIISEPYGIFDYSYFGQILFRVYFKGGYISDKDKESILSQLRSNPYVVSVYELNGEFDLAIEIESPNPSRFNKEIKKIATFIPTLNNYKILLNVVTTMYSHKFLVASKALHNMVPSTIIIGGDRERQSFTKNELSIIKILLSNPRMRLSSLAKETGLAVRTVSSTIASLKEKKIIRGFKFQINAEKHNISKFRLFLKLHNMSMERESEIMHAFASSDNIIQVNKTVGDWDMEVDIESLDKSKIRTIVGKIREEYKDIIQNFNMIEFYKVHKRAYLPQYLFEEQKEQNGQQPDAHASQKAPIIPV